MITAISVGMVDFYYLNPVISWFKQIIFLLKNLPVDIVCYLLVQANLWMVPQGYVKKFKSLLVYQMVQNN